MLAEEHISLDCPNCGDAIYKPLSWFKETYVTCPACQGGLAASQFDAQLAAIEEILDDAIDEMVRGEKPSCGCGGKSSGCCGGGGHA